MVAIFVVLTVLLLIAVDAALERRKKSQEAPQASSAAVPYRASEPVLPAGLFAHSGHTWAEILRLGLVRVGLDDFVRYALGRPDRLILRQSGEEVQQGEPVLTVEQAGRRLVLPAPVSGVIENRNEHLVANPDALERGVYGENWVYTLKPSRLGEEIGSLKVAEKAETWLREERQHLADWVRRLAPLRPGVAVQDGGMPVPGLLRLVDDKPWQEFQEQFLT